MAISISNIPLIWKSSTQVYNGIGVNISATAYANTSNLIGFHVNEQPRFVVDADGNIVASGNITVAGVLSSDTSSDTNFTGNVSVGKQLTTDSTSANSLNVNIVNANSITANSLTIFGDVSLSGNVNLSNTIIGLNQGGTGTALPDPNADRIFYWNNSSNSAGWLNVGTGLAISNSTNTLTTSAGMLTLASGTLSVNATLDIVLTPYLSTYKKLAIHLDDVLVDVDNRDLQLRFSTDGGTSFVSNSSYRYYYSQTITSSNAASPTQTESATEIKLVDNIGNLSDEGVPSLKLELVSAASSTKRTLVTWSAFGVSSIGTYSNYNGWGRTNLIQDTNAIRLFMSSGNLVSGTWTVYGYT